FRRAYKFDIYAHEPMSRSFTYVDANNGSVLWQHQRIHTADTVGVGVTGFYGVQSIITDQFADGFRLRESGRGNGISTYNLETRTNFGSAVDFTDEDNYWVHFNAERDEFARDAYWGTEMTYDYFSGIHNRNSIDNTGFELISYVHYGLNFGNAFWNGSSMTYGDGGGSGSNPFTALDICGHEVSHGLTNFTANLIYRNESGALNESFSDIFGAAIERFARPLNSNWLIGEDLGFIIRNMADPNSEGDPDTYQGNQWEFGPFDNGGVHINSGVQNFWFYLLTEGGTGTNDLGNSYNVPSIGIDKAAKIAFRNLTTYLSPSSNYSDARFYAIQATIDLYGACSPEMEAVTRAWYAVGVGDAYTPPMAISDFRASSIEICNSPAEVTFRNTGQFATTYQWDFGDGNSSTDFEPTHAYQATGTYNVSLTVSGNCGTDTEVKSSYINVVTPPTVPTASGGQVNCNQATTLTASASGSGSIVWQDADGKILANGNTFNTPALSETSTYFVRNREEGVTAKVGPPDVFFGGGAYYNNVATQFIFFDVQKDIELKSVWVDAGAAGDRTIKIWDNNGNELFSLDRNIPSGGSRVSLDLLLKPGGYAIGGSALNLFRHDSGPTYPYEIPGIISILGSSAGEDNYYFFYDWEVTEYCLSAPATAIVEMIGVDAPIVQTDTICEGGNALLISSNLRGKTNWYDQNNTLLAQGDSFTTEALAANTIYFAENEVDFPAVNSEPLTSFFGSGGFQNDNSIQYLEFTVLNPILLETVSVHANSAGNRNIQLWDANGALISTISMNIEFGFSDLELNIELQPGSYRLGGRQMDLFRNNLGVLYPYGISDLLEITGSSSGPDSYYFFYNWKISQPSCFSDLVPVEVMLSAEPLPIPAFAYTVVDAQVDFSNQSQNTSTYFWDLGDGTTSTDENPSHTYIQKGTYQVSLTVNNGPCSEVTLNSITIDFVPGDWVFTAELVGQNAALLEWVVTGADDIKGYDVEYAYEANGTMPALSQLDFVSVLQPENYTYTVPNLQAGLHHFRIKQIDNDGNTRLSQVETLSIFPLSPQIKIWPNPATDKATLEVALAQSEGFSIKVYNDLGQVIRVVHDGEIQAGLTTYQIVTSDLANGMYYLHMINNNTEYFQKFLVLH
ncbi:MAG: M4 family metallopeptidase, partial [Bacteroidia bacterium]